MGVSSVFLFMATLTGSVSGQSHNSNNFGNLNGFLRPLPTPAPPTAPNGFTGTVYERLIDNSIGDTISSASIVFRSEFGNLTRSAYSDSRGWYSMVLPVGRYYVTAIHSSYSTYSSSPGFFVVSGTGMQTGNIFLFGITDECTDSNRPVITALAPTSGDVGDVVTITGVWRTAPTMRAHCCWRLSTSPMASAYDCYNAASMVGNNTITCEVPSTVSTIAGHAGPELGDTVKVSIHVWDTTSSSGSNHGLCWSNTNAGGRGEYASFTYTAPGTTCNILNNNEGSPVVLFLNQTLSMWWTGEPPFSSASVALNVYKDGSQVLSRVLQAEGMPYTYFSNTAGSYFEVFVTQFNGTGYERVSNVVTYGIGLDESYHLCISSCSQENVLVNPNADTAAGWIGQGAPFLPQAPIESLPNSGRVFDLRNDNRPTFIYQIVEIPDGAQYIHVSGLSWNSIANSGISGYGYLWGSFQGESDDHEGRWVQNFDVAESASPTFSRWISLSKVAAVPSWAHSFYLKMARSGIRGQVDTGNIAQFDNLSIWFDCDLRIPNPIFNQTTTTHASTGLSTATPTVSPTTPTTSPTSAPTAPTTAPTAAPTTPSTTYQSTTSGTSTTSSSTQPTPSPTPYPSPYSTPYPTPSPTPYPSPYPTPYPSPRPSPPPHRPITSFPTISPSVSPTLTPTGTPTISPSYISPPPTYAPSINPTDQPSTHPTTHPSTYPTLYPTLNPTTGQTAPPYRSPTMSPSMSPSKNPTQSPSLEPQTSSPTTYLTHSPSSNPTFAPTLEPTANPFSVAITTSSSSSPTSSPTYQSSSTTTSTFITRDTATLTTTATTAATLSRTSSVSTSLSSTTTTFISKTVVDDLLNVVTDDGDINNVVSEAISAAEENLVMELIFNGDLDSINATGLVKAIILTLSKPPFNIDVEDLHRVDIFDGSIVVLILFDKNVTIPPVESFEVSIGSHTMSAASIVICTPSTGPCELEITASPVGNDNWNSSESSDATVVAIVAVIFVLVLSAVIVVLIQRYRRQSNKVPKDVEGDGSDTIQGSPDVTMVVMNNQVIYETVDECYEEVDKVLSDKHRRDSMDTLGTKPLSRQMSNAGVGYYEPIYELKSNAKASNKVVYEVPEDGLDRKNDGDVYVLKLDVHSTLRRS